MPGIEVHAARRDLGNGDDWIFHQQRRTLGIDFSLPHY
jgi:hypothetical protein